MITSKNDAPVFFDATWQYYSKEDPITPEACDLVSITRSYSRIKPFDPDAHSPDHLIQPDEEDAIMILASGIRIHNLNPEPQPPKACIPLEADEWIEAGELIEVTLTITANQPLEYLLAEDRKPAGFETVGTKSGYHQGSFREFHDERVSFYLDWISKGTTTLTYRMRPEHAGTVRALPATIELMYEPRQAANTIERKLQVLRKP